MDCRVYIQYPAIVAKKGGWTVGFISSILQYKDYTRGKEGWMDCRFYIHYPTIEAKKGGGTVGFISSILQ